ncbi:capsular biosynthesis protein, partial [Halalkalibacterium halodurans]|nr:capsular biosynthesis protein [Halalkalibacterium halodurans]
FLNKLYKNLGFDIKDYPNAFRMYENEITLPLHTLLSGKDVEYIANQLFMIVENL